MEHRDEGDTSKSSSVRIWLCGSLTVEWLDPATGLSLSTQDMSSGGREYATAFSLLKLLLCQPQRRAHRDWIMEQFWPESGRSTATHRLENIFSVARKIARHPLTGESFLRSFRAGKENGMVYQLAAYPLLWVDVDALIWNVEQAARMERFGDDAQPFWERAYALAKRGSFLADDVYIDWVVQRRDEVEGYYRQSVHALVRWYLARYGKAGEEESLLILRSYWQQHMADEDALRLLMDLLRKQERYQEALEYYQCLVDYCNQEEYQPDERTQDIAEFCRTSQLRRKTSNVYIPGTSDQVDTGSLFTPHAQWKNLTVSQVLDGALPLNTTRRDLLQHMVGLIGATALAPATLLTHGQSAALSHQALLAGGSSSEEVSEEALQDFAQLTETCRNLSEGNELKVAEQVLWSYLPRVEAVAKTPSLYQKTAANITAQSYILAASLIGHQNDLQSRQYFSEQALFYGEIAQSAELQVAALRQLAVTFDYLALPEKVLFTYQRALPHLPHVPPRLQACIYAALSGVYAQMQQEQEAHRFIGLAYERYPRDKQNEPGYLRTINASYHTLVLWDGLNHLELGKPRQAQKILGQIQALSPSEQIPERIRIELLNYQAKALLAIGDLEQSCVHIETAVDLATTIGSRRRFQEAYAVFHQMKETWPTETRILKLGDVFLQRMINQL